MPSSHNGHISITGVSKYYGRHKALDDVSLEIPPGTVTVISPSFASTLRRWSSIWAGDFFLLGDGLSL